MFLFLSGYKGDVEVGSASLFMGFVDTTKI